MHGRHSGVLGRRKVDEKERQKATSLPDSPIFQSLFFFKVTFSRIAYLVPSLFIVFSLVKKVGMPAVT